MKSVLYLVVTLFLLASCATPKESPVIYISNISTSPISDIKCVWAWNDTLTLPHLYPGDSRGQSFYISQNKDFFGPVSISWKNSQGRRISREFDFKKNNLPSIEISRSYDYVQFYLDQEGLEIVSSDAPNLSYKSVRMDKKLRDAKRYHDAKKGGASSLIRVKHNNLAHFPHR